MAIEGFDMRLTPLTIRNPETGRLLTASVYTIDGVEGTFSMGQLVFAICAAIALEREQALVGLMNEIDDATDKLKGLTDIQSALIDWFNAAGVDETLNEQTLGVSVSYGGQTYDCTNWRQFLVDVCETAVSEVPAGTNLTRDEVEALINSISDKMDSFNAINNDQLIQMQSETSKRDQAFDLLTNILKSFNRELLGNANNLL